MQIIPISVTALAEFVSRSGNISSGTYNGVSGIEGTRLHQRIFSDLRRQYGENLRTEVFLEGSFLLEGHDMELHVAGRADVFLFENGSDIPHIIEIKSFNSSKNSFEKLVRPEHIAQVEIYAALFMAQHPEVKSIEITLRYVSVTSLEAFENTMTVSAEDAEDIFRYHCAEYLDFIGKLIQYNESMIESIRNMRFPYQEIRAGQGELMKRVLKSLCSKEALFALAPTGIGKTISTLFPAVKGLIKGQYSKIFYLTAKTATRQVAAKALNDMRAGGLIIRSILLSSKESMCPHKKKCDAKGCIFSEGYYSRLKPALREILIHDEITPELTSQIALKHRLCPHEFALDTMNYCNVVIGDYNHAFDPRVSLIRCFGEEADMSSNAILIDEAHNLVDRAREMFSASLPHSLLNDMIRLYSKYKDRNPRLEALLAHLNAYYEGVGQEFKSGNPVFVKLEGIDERKIMSTENWEGTRERPKEFYALLWKTIRVLSMELDDIPAGQLRETSMQFFFESRFFLTVFEQEYNDSYISCCFIENGDIIMRLTCLDCSDKLDARIRDKMPVVFFSATLSPYEYYRNVLIGKDADYSRSITLSSPFPPENLEVIIDTEISTTYKNREHTITLLADKIYQELQHRLGNYMIFMPSFAYLNRLCDELSEILEKDAGMDYLLIRQTPGMCENEKKEFLRHFDEPSERCLIGAAVLGGHFSEGIDLVGDRLSGVIIVGTGLPKVTAERQILCNYYTEKFGDGFAFAYRFPGWEKVLQAVGRVIRTEEDTGFALLIDERLDQPEYISLFPDHWKL